MKLIIASNNNHKLVEIKAILGDCFEDIKSMKEAGIDHETVEDGETFYDNALKKAREIADISGCCALADDSGICVDALGGAPGVHSARFCGHHGDDEANNRLLLEKIAKHEDKSAHYTCSMVLVTPEGEIFSAEEYMYGEITDNPAGENGFGYDPLFYLPRLGKTAAQISPEEKNQISHRGKALRKLLGILKSDSRFC